MFPYWDSCSSSNCGQPFPYSINHQHHTMEGSSSSSVAAEAAASLSVDSNLNSSLPPSLSHFPGFPFLDDEDLFLTHFLSPQHHHFCAPVPFPENDLEQEPHLPRPHDKKKKKKAIDRAEGPPRKMRGRSKGKKDRHSKICTAKGPRDRRMRLSLHIARKFFDLQDMLGFDKASKTIDWLFSKSKSAIKDLMGTPNLAPPPPPPPRLELVSTDDEKSSKGKPRNGGACYHEPVAARESREKARARARERTKEKNLIRQSLHTELLVNPNHQTSFGGGMSGSRSPEFNNSPNSVEVAAEEAEATSSSIEHRMATVRILEELMGMHASTGDPQFQGYAAMETNKNSSISFTTGTASTATTDSIAGFDEDDLIAATYHYHHHHNLY